MERWSLYGGLHKNGAEQRESITTGTIFLQNLTSRTVLLLLRAVRESLRAVPNTNVDNNERNKTRPVFETFAATTKLLPIYPFFFFKTIESNPQFSRDLVNHPLITASILSFQFLFFFFIIRFSLGITGDGKMGDASIGCALFPAVIVAAARLVNIITSWFLFFFFFFLFFFSRLLRPWPFLSAKVCDVIGSSSLSLSLFLLFSSPRMRHLRHLRMT